MGHVLGRWNLGWQQHSSSCWRNVGIRCCPWGWLQSQAWPLQRLNSARGDQNLCPDSKWWDQIPGFVTAQECWRGAAELPDSGWSDRGCWNRNTFIRAVTTTAPGVTLTLTPSAPQLQDERLHLDVRLEGFSTWWYQNHGITGLGRAL